MINVCENVSSLVSYRSRSVLDMGVSRWGPVNQRVRISVAIALFRTMRAIEAGIEES